MFGKELVVETDCDPSKIVVKKVSLHFDPIDVVLLPLFRATTIKKVSFFITSMSQKLFWSVGTYDQVKYVQHRRDDARRRDETDATAHHSDHIILQAVLVVLYM